MGEIVVVDCEEDLGMEEVERMEEEEEERERGVVRWEEYLPRMVIRVLLVEADDSTRQIIAALLRKCNYKVAAIPDGLKAWEILKQKHSNIDLILTEVDLPSISGYALLTLIMEHDGCKKIPVIMMSSSDSISTVFKCMLKGAADFLIKPVRRNELKNLWQHVWRRISANNASGVQNLCGDHCKAETSSKNRGTRNCSDDNASSSKEKCQSPEKAPDAQGLSQMKNHGTSSLSHNDVLQHEEGMRLDEETNEGKSTRFVPSGVADGNDAYASTSRLERVGSSSGRTARVERSEPASSGNMECLPNGELGEHTVRAIDLIGTINNHLECAQEQFSSSCKMHNSNSTPQLELCLSRSSDRDDRKTDGKHKLNHSNASAFSRYSSNKKLRTLFPSLDNSPAEVEGGDKFLEKLVASPKPVVNAFSIDEENKSTDMTVSTAHLQQTFPVPQLGLVPVPGVGFGGTFPGYGPIYPSVFTPQVSLGAIGLRSANQKESSSLLASTSLQSDPGTYCSSMGHSGFDETSNHEEKVPSVDQQKCANGTASQTANSAFRSNGHTAHLQNNAINDNANQATVRTDNTEEEHPKDGGGGFVLTSEQPGRAKGVLHSSQRQAALAKFRQKRKDRCFEKKVRYQSRKKLAEQRPRVKGQFVRQVQSDQPVAVSDTGHEDNG